MTRHYWPGEHQPEPPVIAPPAEHKEHRVIGPPGTGKTWYLSQQVKRLVTDHRFGAHNVLIGSLTRAAAHEITYAAQETIGAELPRETVGTLHAHAFRGLDRPELAETTKGLKAWNDWIVRHGELVKYRIDVRSARDIEWGSPEQDATDGGEGGALLALLAVVRARMTPPELWPDGLTDFADRWGKFKQDENLHDFTDLIERAIHELPVAPGNPKVILFDEAQDSSRLEFTLLRQWGDRADQLVVVGDPWQNLYEWRGSDPAAFFDRDAASQIVLSRSRRVPQRVLDYAVSWVERAPTDLPRFAYDPRFNDVNDDTSGVAEGTVDHMAHGWKEPAGLINRVIDDTARGDSVMVLVSCAYMLAPLIEGLRERGVPFANPYRPAQGAWNPLRGVERLLAFLRPHGPTWGAESRIWTWEDADKWADPMRAKGVWTRGSKSLIDAKNTPRDRFDETPGRSVDMTRFLALLETDHHAERAMALDVDWWLEHLRDDHRRRAEYGVHVFHQHGGAALRDRPLLTIGTIHSVKGAEADHVYVFPDLSRVAFEDTWFVPQARAPVYRQFYVAFTRARRHLTLLDPSGNTYVNFPVPQEAPA